MAMPFCTRNARSSCRSIEGRRIDVTACRTTPAKTVLLGSPARPKSAPLYLVRNGLFIRWERLTQGGGPPGRLPLSPPAGTEWMAASSAHHSRHLKRVPFRSPVAVVRRTFSMSQTLRKGEDTDLPSPFLNPPGGLRLRTHGSSASDLYRHS